MLLTKITKLNRRQLRTLVPAILMTVVSVSMTLNGRNGQPVAQPPPKPAVARVVVPPNNKPTENQPLIIGRSNPVATEADAKNTHASSILQAKDYPQYRYEALQTPNDNQYSGSWYHQKLQTNRGWDMTTGGPSTVIAVIDTGFALAHQDLSSQWATNVGEQGTTNSSDTCWTGSPASKATNNCDDDQNGYVDDWRGWDFESSDNNPQSGLTVADGNGTQHGTMVSSIIGAAANNSVGNAGIDWQAKIMPLQVLSDNGSGYTYDIVAAIQYATDNGANVINLSLGGPDFDQAMLDAVNYATDLGVLVVAASGNCGDSSVDECAFMPAPGRMAYPARYDNVLSVGATNSTDARASFSSYGAELDIVAPGSSVGPLASWSSSIQTSGYVSAASGTSFASPMVAGLAGLLRAQLGEPSVAQLRAALIDSTDKVAGLSGQNRSDTYGYGRINAHKATLLAQAIAVLPVALGSTSMEGRQPAKGALVRSTSGNVASDEWLLAVCRVEASDVCTGATKNGSTLTSITATNNLKGSQIYYLFLSGANLGPGTSTISLNNRHYSTQITTVTR